jgi:Protein of unknown function (DUF3015)
MKALLVVLFSVFSVAHANSGVGPAGCGLGNVVFGTDTQIVASTTNGSSGSQTFGITSGTSNCVDSGKMAQLNNFVESNKVALAKEAARGEGETLVGLTQIVGCRAEFGTKIKSHYQQIFSSDDSKDISGKILQVAQNNPGFCS